jgi:2,4-dienoyl-CoA reductase-like NADH-dependent reductase (Old Yellow Enzyme family)
VICDWHQLRPGSLSLSGAGVLIVEARALEPVIADPHQAEIVIAEGKADCVAVARGFLDDPHWAWHAADALGAEVACPSQYLRSRPTAWPGAALAHPSRAKA